MGKLGMLSAALGPTAGRRAAARVAVFVAVLLGCGLLALIALTRTGIRTFWSGASASRPGCGRPRPSPSWRCSACVRPSQSRRGRR